MEFQGFPKIPRLSREVTITEKIDGTNAQICITSLIDTHVKDNVAYLHRPGGGYLVYAGSRNRWITPQNDNHGFAKWVDDNLEELVEVLGEGRHFGEWWGSGINRGYGLLNGEKRFSLFNTGKWNDENKPDCCSVVPTLYTGAFDTEAITSTLFLLQVMGSAAAPGFMNPEGIIIYHTAANSYFKKTIKDDEKPKALV